MSFPRHIGLDGLMFKVAKATEMHLMDVHQIIINVIAIGESYAASGYRIKLPVAARRGTRTPQARRPPEPYLRYVLNKLKLAPLRPRPTIRVIDNKLKFGAFKARLPFGRQVHLD